MPTKKAAPKKQPIGVKPNSVDIKKLLRSSQLWTGMATVFIVVAVFVRILSLHHTVHSASIATHKKSATMPPLIKTLANTSGFIDSPHAVVTPTATPTPTPGTASSNNSPSTNNSSSSPTSNQSSPQQNPTPTQDSSSTPPQQPPVVPVEQNVQPPQTFPSSVSDFHNDSYHEDKENHGQEDVHSQDQGHDHGHADRQDD